jgi:hypothetical protein
MIGYCNDNVLDKRVDNTSECLECKGYIDRESRIRATRLVFHKLNSDPLFYGGQSHQSGAMIDMAIPQFLWPLILETIVHITNHTATSKLKGKTPCEALTDELNRRHDNRPSVAHFRVLRCKTYVQIPKEKRVISAKVAERAEVGILVRYEGTHIFKIYVPTHRGPLENRIVRSSNVRFDEGGLITKPFPDEDEIENDNEDASITLPYRARGETNYDKQLIQRVSKTQDEEHHLEIETNNENNSIIPEPELDESDQEVDDEDTELLPTVTVRRTRKVYTPKPEFNRVTCNQTRERPQQPHQPQQPPLQAMKLT